MKTFIFLLTTIFTLHAYAQCGDGEFACLNKADGADSMHVGSGCAGCTKMQKKDGLRDSTDTIFRGDDSNGNSGTPSGTAGQRR